MSNGSIKFYSELDDIKTFGSETSAPISFKLVNKTSTNIKAYWIHDSGKEYLYATITPNNSYLQPTNTTHAWSVRDADGKLKFKFYPSELGTITAYDGYQEFSRAVKGTAGNDNLVGTVQDDEFESGAGNDTISGDEGIDTVIVPGKQSDYTISYNKDTSTYKAVSTTHGTKLLTNIEYIRFNDDPSSPLSLVGYEQLLQYDVTNIQVSGSHTNRVNLIFVSEGYREAERAKFLTDASQMFEVLLGAENQRLNTPLHEYRKFFNALAIFVPSKESGIDDTLAGIKVDTVFNAATYGSDGRLAYGDWKLVDTVLNLALETTGTEMIAGLMNTSLYAGGGGFVGWVASDMQYAGNTLIHELGHSYAKLQDEYLDPALVETNLLEWISDSVHVSASKTELNWSHWLGYEDELGTVGAYEGGYYRETGVWRATETSAMRDTQKPFSAPQKEEWIRRFYDDVGDYLTLEFSNTEIIAKVLEAKVLSFSWSIDDENSGNTQTLNLDTRMDVPAIIDTTPIHQTIAVSTVDSTGMLRKESIIESTRQHEKIDLLLGSNSADRVLGTSKSEVIMTGSGDDTLRGLSGDDTLVGGPGNDILIGGSGNDYMDGGAGIDIAVFSEIHETYSIERNSLTITIANTNEGEDQLKDVERIEFKDKNLAFDLNGNAGKTVKLLGAFLGGDGAKNPLYVTDVLNLLDNGMPYNDLMQLALNAILGENPTGGSVIKHFYTSLTGQEAPSNILEAYGSSIDNGELSTVDLALQVAEHELNLVNIDFVGLSALGIEYI